MKKNISINLFGTLYNIDEDAYNLMESYLQSMKRYFSRQEGGEEVADDIEHRVAELLWQRREAGMTAINIETVKEIIDTIGNAEQIASDSGEEQGTTAEGQDATFKESFSQFTKEAERFTRDTYDRGRNHVNTHHFYRRADDKILGGVCSGAAAYFNSGDSLVWRLSAVLGTLLLSWIGIGLFIPIVYIVLWLLAPVAVTPEDRLRMQGKEITPENLAQQVKEESQRPIVVQNNDGCAGGCLKVLLVFIGMIVLFPFIISAIALIFAIVMVAGVGTAMVGGLLPRILCLCRHLPAFVPYRPDMRFDSGNPAYLRYRTFAAWRQEDARLCPYHTDCSLAPCHRTWHYMRCGYGHQS